MGTFCTTTSLAELMLGTTFNTATTSLVSKCITWAENDIRKHLSKRYDLSADAFQTSTSTPPVIQTMCEQLSMGYSYRVMSRGSKESLKRASDMIDPVMDQLKDIADYKIDVIDSNGTSLSNKSTRPKAQSNTGGYTETFQEDSILNWEIDSDKIDDISSSRS